MRRYTKLRNPNKQEVVNLKQFDIFRSKPSKSKYYAIFEETYKKVLDHLKESKIVKNADQELLPFMWVLSDYAVALSGKNKEERKAVGKEIEAYFHELFLEGLSINYDVFNNRQDFYLEIIKGKPLRPEWDMIIDMENQTGKNATPRLVIALTQVLTYPTCVENYENAPVLIFDVFDMIYFAPIMVRMFNYFVYFFKKTNKA